MSGGYFSRRVLFFAADVAPLGPPGASVPAASRFAKAIGCARFAFSGAGEGDLVPSMLRRDGPPMDVLQRLPAALVRLRVRPLAAHTVYEYPAPHAGFFRLARQTITGHTVTITSLKHRAITNQGSERPVERSNRDTGGRLDVRVCQRRQWRAPEDPGDLFPVAHSDPLV